MPTGWSGRKQGKYTVGRKGEWRGGREWVETYTTAQKLSAWCGNRWCGKGDTFNPLRYAFRGNGSKCDLKSWGEAETVLGTGGTGEGYAAEGKFSPNGRVTE